MLDYSILLRRQRYPSNLMNFMQDLEILKLPGKWAAVVDLDDGRTSAKTAWFENGRLTRVGGKEFTPLWLYSKSCTVALLKTMAFGDKDLVREFITGLDLQDFEFYAIARGSGHLDYQPGHGWYGIVNMGVLEFEEEGDIIELLRS